METFTIHPNELLTLDNCIKEAIIFAIATEQNVSFNKDGKEYTIKLNDLLHYVKQDNLTI